MLRIKIVVLIAALLGACASLPGRDGHDSRLDQAVALMKENKLDDALALLHAADHTPGVDPVVRVNIAIILRARGDLANAEQALEPVFHLQSVPPAAAYNQMGLIYREQARFSDALDIYRQGRAHYPEYSYIARNMGVLCEIYLRDMTCAEEAYASYLEQVDDKDADISSATGNDDQVKAWLDTTRSRL